MAVVHRLDPQDQATAQRWDAFVLACPQASFFHRAGWQRMVGEVFGHDTYFLYAEHDGVIQGVLPLGHVNSWLFGNSLVGLPFAVYGGVAAVDEATATLLETEAQAIARKLGVDHLELRNVAPRHPDWPTQ
ncbi:MAG: peptidoglycan bridge formation protein FemAB, partial [Rhodoferax sp.]|nr:peptidoglycan bridge formation protein FemAB [Rhodoferax sp.]